MNHHESAGGYYHAQESYEWCGAAVAITVLSDAQVGASILDLEQMAIFNEAKVGACVGTNLRMCPKGLEYVLNLKKPTGSALKFEAVDYYNWDIATAKIVATLSPPASIAPAILTLGDMHWIAVNAVDLAKEGSGYRPLAFWVYDPWTVEPPNKKHENPDACGSLGVEQYAFFYPEGWRRVFSGMNYGMGSRFTCVHPSGLSSGNLLGGVPPLKIEDIPRDNDGRILTDPKVIDDVLLAWLQASGGFPINSPAFGVLETSKVLNVRFLEECEEHFAILKHKGKKVASLSLHPESGFPISIQLHKPDSPMQTAYSRLDVELVDKRLFWRPCLESFSPHLPFFRRPDGQIERLDGRVFSGLTTDIRGV